MPDQHERSVTILASSTTDWLIAVGGLGVFIATVVLVWLAYRQMEAARVQVRDAREQSDAALAIAEQQASAAVAVARETREAAQRQWQPRVFVHGKGEPVPGNGDNAAPDEMAVAYYLSNEGTGPAFNVEHGVEIEGRPYTWEDRQWRTMRAGEFIPQLDADSAQPVPSTAIVVGVKLAHYGEGRNRVYWSRFENLLGDRYEVRNPAEATRRAEVRPLPRLDPREAS